MDQTAYGYKINEAGDPAKGATGWYAAYNFNWERISGHNHDGNNSVQLAVNAFSPYTGTITAVGWVVNGAGYAQTVTVPVGVTEINNYNTKFVATAPPAIVGQIVDLNYKRLTATTYEIYCNDNTLALFALYR